MIAPMVAFMGAPAPAAEEASLPPISNPTPPIPNPQYLTLTLTLTLPSCGDTVAEDHSFGAVHGAAARLSEHSQLCRLDADGLCSAGLKTLQPPT